MIIVLIKHFGLCIFFFLYLCQKKVSILKNALLKNKTANKIPLTKYTMLVAKAQRLEKKRK